LKAKYLRNRLFEKIRYHITALSCDKKSVLALVGGTTLAQALSFLLFPIQTRLFSPEVFGELSVFTSITGIISIIICLRYELAIVLPKEDDEGFSLLKLSWFFAAILSLVSSIIFGFWGKRIYILFNASALTRYWYYVPITLMLTGIIQAANYWLTRRRQFTILSYNKVLPVLTVNFVSIGLGFAGNRALNARLFSILAGNLVNIAVLACVLIPDLQVKRREQYSKKELIKKNKNFLLYDIWGALINNLSWMIVPILMNSYYGSYAAGQYSIGLRVIQIPASIIGASIGQVFLKTASDRRYTKNLYVYTKSIARKLLIYTSPFAIIILVLGKYFFKITFGDQWELAGIYSQILAPWAFIWFISSPLSAIYTILQKQNVLLILTILNLITRFVSIYLGSILYNEKLGIIIFSLSGFFIYSFVLYGALKLAKNNDIT
jgi:O-antigen/teichoic acid export membrane protein